MMKRQSTDRRERVQFELSAAAQSRVFVAGTFNNWDPTANPLRDDADSGDYKAAVRLPAGTHEYKFVVDGVWTVDPRCADRVANDSGSQNSVLRV
jgi:1,4-alpha-glucan branching enzyme